MIVLTDENATREALNVILTEIYFDFESSGLDPYTCHVFLLALHFNNETYVIDCTKVKQWASLVKPLFENPAIIKVAQNAVFDTKFLFYYGIDTKNVYCTMITEQLLNSGIPGLSNSLQAIALRRLREGMDKSIREGFIGRSPDDIHFDQIEYEYAAKDVEVLPPIRDQQLAEIKQEQMERVHDLEMQLIPVTAQMEYWGIGVDLKKVYAAIPAFEKVHKNADVELQTLAINAGISDKIVFSKDGFESVVTSSPPQMLAFFNAIGIDVESTKAEELAEWDARWVERQKREKKNLPGSHFEKRDNASYYVAENNDDTLESLYKHPVLRQHAIRTATEKTLSTYLYPLPNRINPVTQRVHPRFNQCGARATGRYSSSEPKQNWAFNQ